MATPDKNKPKTAGEHLRDLAKFALFIGAVLVGAEVIGDL